MKIAFIGLGNMGMPMALNLNKSKKIQLIGFDINNHSVQKFKKSKGKVAKTLDEAFECDIIISCLPGPKQIRQIAIGKNKLIEKLSKIKFGLIALQTQLVALIFYKKN